MIGTRLLVMRRAPSRRSGWALVWIILTLAIIAVLFAAAAPMLVTLDDRARAQNAAAQLRIIAAGFDNFGPVVGNYPGRVSQLTNLITTSDKNSCSGVMTSSNVSNWSSNAPYGSIYTTPGGTWTDIGRIRDSVPARPGPPPGTMPGSTPIYVEIPGVSGNVAAILDLLVDHGIAGTDTVTFAAPVNDTTTIRYRVVAGTHLLNRC
jgi:type II secretory pathway pseudopilin PulG